MPKYVHLSQRNQILKRPGQHIGSPKNATTAVWLADGESIVEREISYNPGLLHIFYEVLGNAQDNYFRSRDTETPLKKIEITIDCESGSITVWNDGLWIPARIHEWGDDEEVIDQHDHYEAEIIFGHLNTSSNFEDQVNKRVGGGLHGVGVKLTNIFSSEFRVEAFDPDAGIKFVGVWSENMSQFAKPKITSCKQKKGYTKVTYTADFGRFGISGYTADHVSVMKKMAIDCAMVTGQKVLFNGEKIPVKDLNTYSNFYIGGSGGAHKVEFKSPDSTVILCDGHQTSLNQMSWVNGIYTASGGVHVDEWRKAIFKPLLEKIANKYSTKDKPFKLTVRSLEQYFTMFVVCNLENPEFNGQTKGSLTSPAPTVNVTAGKISAIMRWPFVQEIEETIKLQGIKDLKKTDGKKTSSVNILHADDANKAGSARSSECTLFITEGLSAKTFAEKGIATIDNGTDYYGILPVRGKVLNVRGASAAKINENKEITQLKTMLGLKHGVDYSSDSAFKTLRYGKVCILTDADPDGDHIKGLIINFFQYFFPSLLEREYVTSLRTPIVKATIGKKVVTFYYLKTFKDWANAQSRSFVAKYYKGLGTNQDEDVLEAFEKPRNVQFVTDTESPDTVSMVFDKKRSDDRKKWLENYVEREFIYKETNGAETVPITEFFNNEMIGFSIYDNKRSIPSVVDGFKPSQRKALWVGLKTLTTNRDLKVAQFAAAIANKAEYHHGENSMEQAVIGMAQTFVGSNNIALLFEAGQFGTRGAGGEDASASRYLYTRLASITRFIFRKEDDPILEYLEEDGHQIEPKFFVPIIPMIAVNGCHGIGTGYSTDIPAFNPLDLVEWIRVWLGDQNAEPDAFPDLVPWYWGFKGWTERDPNRDSRFIHYGMTRQISENQYEITELPVGVWTADYKVHLNTLMNGASSNSKAAIESMTVAELKQALGKLNLPMSGTKKDLVERLKKGGGGSGAAKKTRGSGDGPIVTKWEWHGDPYNIRFKVWTKPGVVVDHTNPKFKLTGCDSLTNMTAFSPSGGIKKYESLYEILSTFCKVRLKYYQRRKKRLLAELENKLAEHQAKARFIKEVLDDFELLKQTESELWDYLEAEEYWKKTSATNIEADGEGDNGGDGGSYNYLTGMPVRSFTTDHREKLLKQIKDILADIEYVRKKTPVQMWSVELDEFVKAYAKWKDEMDAMHAKLAKSKIQSKSKAKAKKK